MRYCVVLLRTFVFTLVAVRTRNLAVYVSALNEFRTKLVISDK
jgi:hypothetical protein